MAVESLSERPIFASEENQYLLPAQPPISRMAVASAILGLISALVLLNADLMVLPILAVSVGLAAYWVICRNDAIGGRTLALVGVGLGVAFSTWSVTTVQLRNQYLYQVGSQFAKNYLETVGEAKLLEAYELMQPEAARQVAGTSLKAHYDAMDEMSRSDLDSFRNDTITLKVQERGSKAQWQFRRGVGVSKIIDGERHVTVRMADTSSPSPVEIEITLARHHGASVASWRVARMK